MKLKKLVVLVLLLCVGACSHVGLAPRIPRPFLWEIEKDGRSSYVLGTIHRGVPIEDLHPVVLKYLDKSRILVSEADFGRMEEHGLWESDASVSLSSVELENAFEMDPDEVSLDQRLTPQEWATFQAKLAGLWGYPNTSFLDGEQIKRLHPEFAAELMAAFHRISPEQSSAATQRSLPQFGLDRHLYLYAVKNKKFVGFLEQLDDPLLRECEYESGIVDLKRFILPPPDIQEQSERQLAEMEAAYASGDEAIVRDYMTSMSQTDDVCLLRERNLSWMPIFEKYHEMDAPVFYAMGLAHLIPPRQHEDVGVFELLKQKGFRVKRIEPNK